MVCYMRFYLRSGFHQFFFDDGHQQMSFWLKSSCNMLRVMFAARREWLLLPPCEEFVFQP